MIKVDYKRSWYTVQVETLEGHASVRWDDAEKKGARHSVTYRKWTDAESGWVHEWHSHTFHVVQPSRWSEPSQLRDLGESGLVYFCAASPHCINRHSTCPSHSLAFLYRMMEQSHPLAQSSSPSVSISPLSPLCFGPYSSPLGPKFRVHNRTYS